MTGHPVPRAARRADRGPVCVAGSRVSPGGRPRASWPGRRARSSRSTRGTGPTSATWRPSCAPREPRCVSARTRPARCRRAPTWSSPRRAGGRTSRCWSPPPTRGVPVWGEVELAWRLRPTPTAPWLGVTGTNGKTTTVRMLDVDPARGRACGRSRAATSGCRCSTRSSPTPPYDVLAVELSSFQLHWTRDGRAPRRRRPQRGAGPPRLARLAGGLRRGQGPDLARRHRAPSYNADDPAVGGLARQPEDAQDSRWPIGVHASACRHRASSGVAATALVDRCSTRTRARTAPAVLARRSRRRRPPAPHNVANALAAAGAGPRARPAGGTGPVRRRDGLRAFRPGAHRIAHVATVDGVDYVDDSKATNPHAAAASLAAFDRRGLDRRRAGQGRAASTSWSRAPPGGCAARC